MMRLRHKKCIPSCASHQRVDEDELCWYGKKQYEKPARSHSPAHIISQLAQCFAHPDKLFLFVANAMVGPRAWIGGFFSRANNKKFGSDNYLDHKLSPIQEQRLRRLQERLGVPFDETRIDHQEALQALWDISFPNVKLRGLISEQWKDMGWQGVNPSTDFRGCGFISLENLLFFARTYPVPYRRLLLKKGGKRAKWEYPFAVAGINVSYMLIQMLDINSEKPKSVSGLNFVKLLGENEEAFDVLFCLAFAMMDAQWLAMRASYMEFNEVLQVTRTQLEREFALEDVHRIQDIPAYNLLYQ